MAESARPFADGDVVSIIGDSITWSRRWHRYIYEYHLTRFPDRRVSFVNAGISGDTAGGVLRPLARDVLVPQPTAAVFLLGMNDAARNGFDARVADDPLTPERREPSLQGFHQNMAELAERLRNAGVRRLIFCSPAQPVARRYALRRTAVEAP